MHDFRDVSGQDFRYHDRGIAIVVVCARPRGGRRGVIGSLSLLPNTGLEVDENKSSLLKDRGCYRQGDWHRTAKVGDTRAPNQTSVYSVHGVIGCQWKVVDMSEPDNFKAAFFESHKEYACVTRVEISCALSCNNPRCLLIYRYVFGMCHD